MPKGSTAFSVDNFSGKKRRNCRGLCSAQSDAKLTTPPTSANVINRILISRKRGGSMDRSNLQHILFALGKALQDLYIAEKSGGGSEFNELQKRVKEGLQILRFLGIGLEAEMIFDIEADGGAEHLFVAAAEWTGSEDEKIGRAH